MTSTPLPLPRVDPVAARRFALFLDFDGTLADIVEHPDDVMLADTTRTTIERLVVALDGAVAIVTGRAIVDIDRFVALPGLPVAGVHGMKRRDAAGTAYDVEVAQEALGLAHQRLSALALESRGTFLEIKPGSLAFHYRGRPDLADTIPSRVGDAIGGLDGLYRVDGKMVVEIKGAKASKGDAVTAFMADAPFAGRVPLFAGDDVTDEDGFRVVNAMGGVTIKIGSGETLATYRADTADAFRGWLAQLALALA